MLTRGQKKQYFRDGYLLVRDILSAEQVAWLRAFFRPKFAALLAPWDSHHHLTDIYVRFPEVRWLCFHEPTLQVLRSLFGEDIVLLPTTVVHFNGFRGWHKDTDYYERAGFTFFKDKDYRMWQVAYYLQDNSSEYGGGLDVEPGSHRQREDPFIHKPKFRKRTLLERLWHQIDRAACQRYWLAWEKYNANGYEPSKVLSIPSKAGDMVVIDFRINHRATPPRVHPSHGEWLAPGLLPVEHEKLAIFSTWSRNNATARALLEASFAKARQEQPEFRFSYPTDFLQEAEKAGVALVY